MARKRAKSRESAHTGRDWLSWVLGSADGFEDYVAQSRSLALSFVLIAPLLLMYEVALVCYPRAHATGAGRVVRDALSSVFRTREGITVNAVVLVLLLVAVALLARRRQLRLNLILPMMLESTAWAVVLVGIAVLIFRRLSNIALNIGSAGPGVLLKVIDSVGAGVYEEILFRLLLTSILYFVGMKFFGERSGVVATFAVTVSALVFAVCHVTAPGLVLFFYFVLGVFFSGLYTWRGLGVAVYTHIIYDIIVELGGH